MIPTTTHEYGDGVPPSEPYATEDQQEDETPDDLDEENGFQTAADVKERLGFNLKMIKTGFSGGFTGIALFMQERMRSWKSDDLEVYAMENSLPNTQGRYFQVANHMYKGLTEEERRVFKDRAKASQAIVLKSKRNRSSFSNN